MGELIKILSSAFQAAPVTVIPTLLTLVLIAYLSYRAYAEFKVIYKKCNADKFELTDRISEIERKLSLTDDKTLMLSMKLEKIENNLEKINCSLIELSTTLKIWREKED